MKNLLLLITAVGMGVFVSCERFDSPDSLTGTCWKSSGVETDYGWWYPYELNFSSTHVTYIHSTDYGSNGQSTTWEYTFDPPTITLERTFTGSDGEQYTQKSVGTVKRKTMTIELWVTLDVIAEVELKKQ